MWQDFVFRVKWSSSSSTGFVELYQNGKLVLYHDGFIMTKNASDVLP